MKRIVVAIALLATILPVIVAANLLTDSWFWPIGVVVAGYAMVVIAVHAVPWRPLTVKIVVLVANALILVWQGAQLISEPSANAWWAQVLAVVYPLLVSASILCLPQRGGLVGFFTRAAPWCTARTRS